MTLEISGSLPDRAGVHAFVQALRAAPGDAVLSIGRVCGGRVSAVWLGETLELRSVTLEAADLDDAHVARAHAEAFIAEFEPRVTE